MPGNPSLFIRFVMRAFRIVLLTVLFTALGMGLGLMAGIVFTVVSAMFRHVQPDMTAAYRTVAIPLAVISGGITFLYTLFDEIRSATRTHA